MTIRVLLRDHPRAVALATDTHVLTFQHATVPSASTHSLNSQAGQTSPQCMVEFSAVDTTDLSDYRSLTSLSIQGTLGLITIQHDVFLCVVNGANRVATPKPGDSIQQITNVEFHCINSSAHDYLLLDQVNRYPTDELDEDGFDQRHTQPTMEHPCLALKKLLSGGSFYYSADFDLTRRMQDRSAESATIALDSLDRGFLWNAFMIQPLVGLRSRMSEQERDVFDASRILTSAIRGFAMTVTVPAASSPLSTGFSGMASSLTLISRLSQRRAGTRFNSRGIDDEGNVANYVESETIFWAPNGTCFSYTQLRGSVPVFWEQAAGFTPGQQKIHLTRSAEATQPAFDKHFAEVETNYGAVHIVNLLSDEKAGELELTRRYQQHVRNSPLNDPSIDEKENSAPRELLKETDYDFHAQTRGLGYEAASGIKRFIQDSVEAFVYYLSEQVEDHPKTAGPDGRQQTLRRPMTILQQEGTFRTNCLDCLDRTNLVQTIISQTGLEEFIRHRGERRSTTDFWVRHGTLWADNGDALSKIYAGTGALKSSFTRSGKMSLAGAIADVRKSATRLYINNFEDKGRQTTIDMLLGRLMGQVPVYLYDPINDYVNFEMSRRTAEYSSTKTIHVFAGTFNLNGKSHGMAEDLSSWLCPNVDKAQQNPEIVAVGFQEIVDLSPQQIMSTDPNIRLAWEDAVKKTLNLHAQRRGSEEYILLRGGQLVGASLSVFVKASILPYIRNVEGSLKKTGLSGMAGNKGAVAIRMEYANTSICLVTAHLAAGFASYQERNQDFRTISHGLRFQRNRSIEDHDTVIWLGDFNYRIGMSNERVRQLINSGDIETLYENDQLNLQMVSGKAFKHYNEARITFLPTYKFDIGTDQYDSSDKARIPAWCDRVLSRGNNLRQTNYNTAPLNFSDHRPVFAIFQCTISIVDDVVKNRISDELYHKRRAIVGKTSVNGIAEASDDDDLLEYEPIELGLPPASSDRHKWWLEGGLPARSQVQAPGNGYVPNTNRPSNPFTPTSEPDWVKVEKPGNSPRSSARIPSIGSTNSTHPPSRNLTPSWKSSGTPSPGGSNGRLSLDQAESRQASTSPNPPLPVRNNQTLRKPAPPIPQKPHLLRSESGTSTATVGSTQSRSVSTSSQIGNSAVATPSLPPPRRSTLQKGTESRSSSATFTNRGGTSTPGSRVVSRSAEDKNPPLPPRRDTGSGNASLMDDERDQMKGWEPLKPGQ